jgi:hypothetical protein
MKALLSKSKKFLIKNTFSTNIGEVMATTVEKLRNMQKTQAKKLSKISNEEEIFSKLQEVQLNINNQPISLEFSEYDLEAPYIRGEFYAIIDKNLYTIHDEVNFQIARTQEEAKKGRKPFGYELHSLHYKQRL